MLGGRSPQIPHPRISDEAVSDHRPWRGEVFTISAENKGYPTKLLATARDPAFHGIVMEELNKAKAELGGLKSELQAEKDRLRNNRHNTVPGSCSG